MQKKNSYKIAWTCLLIVLEKGYPIESWIAPIPEEHKSKMITSAKLYLERKKIQKELNLKTC